MTEAIATPVKKRRFKIVDGKIVSAKTPSPQKKEEPPPPVNKEKKRNSRVQLSHKILEQLSQAYPQSFDMKVRKPLMVGVKETLVEWASKQSIDIIKGGDVYCELGARVRQFSWRTTRFSVFNILPGSSLHYKVILLFKLIAVLREL